eukprot:936984-Pyramimonas_sp.AAC.1
MGRVRRITVLVHKRVRRLNIPKHMSSLSWTSFSELMRRECHIDWKALFRASDEELSDELNWAAGRRASRAGRVTGLSDF